MKQEQDENEDDKKKIKLIEEQEMISHSNGRLSSVARSPRVKYSIMIRNLSIHCTEQDLRELFGSFASPIYRLTIKRSRDGRSLLHGYADCNDVDGGNRLINHFDNYKFMGRRMRLEPCDASQKKLPVQETHASPFQIHFRYESFNVDFGYNTKGEGKGEVRVTEEMIERECGTYGEIVDVAIMRHSQYLDGRRKPQIVLQKGYGFMYFLEARGAERAAAARVIMISGGRVRCELGFSHQVHPEDRLYPGAEDRMSSSSSLSSRTQSPTAVLIPASVSPPLQTPFLSTSTTNISSPPPLYPNLSTGHATAMFYPSTTSSVMAPPTPLYYPGLNASAPTFHPYPFPPPDAFLPPVSDDSMMYQQYPGFFVPPPLYSAASMHYLPWTDYRATQHMQYPPYPTATPADSFPFHYTSPSTPGLPAYHQDSRVGPQSLNQRESGGGEKKSESDPHHK